MSLVRLTAAVVLLVLLQSSVVDIQARVVHGNLCIYELVFL